MDPKTKQETKAKVKGMWASLQDKADVASAKMRRDDGADIEVAIIKATLNEDIIPKEKHMTTLKLATAGSCPRQQVNYVIAGLGNRIDAGKDNWLMTLKTLIVFHRLMREVDPTFQEEMLKFGERTSTRRMLRLDTFADHTTKETWDYSAWVRLYSVYLDERLDAFRTMKFNPENEKNTDSLLKACSGPELLDRLPAMHRLLSRLVACLPVGAATINDVVILSASMVLREVRCTYKVVCEGIMNLADKFFEMDRNSAVRGLEIYKENVVLNDKLNAFFNSVNHISTLKGQVQLPTLQALPPDFQNTLEEYARDAPKGPDATDVPNAATGAPAGAPSAASMLNNIKQGGTTSAALAGSPPPASNAPPSLPAPPGVSLKIGAPAESPPAAAAGGEIDLLGADFFETAIVPPPAPPPPAAMPAAYATQAHMPAASPPPAGPTANGGGAFWSDNAFAAPPPAAAPSPGLASPPAAFSSPPTFSPPPAVASPPAVAPPAAMYPTSSARQEIPLDLFGSPAPAPAPTAYPGYAAPSGVVSPGANPFGVPMAAVQAPANPFNSMAPPPAPMANVAAPVASSSNPFSDTAFSTPQSTASQQQPMAYAPAPPPVAQPPVWSQNHDPLAGLGVDVFGKPAATQPTMQSLNSMRGQ